MRGSVWKTAVVVSLAVSCRDGPTATVPVDVTANDVVVALPAELLDVLGDPMVDALLGAVGNADDAGSLTSLFDDLWTAASQDNVSYVGRRLRDTATESWGAPNDGSDPVVAGLGVFLSGASQLLNERDLVSEGAATSVGSSSADRPRALEREHS